jgi:hypothetical protein
MVVRAEHVTCRREIIDGLGNWTIDKMCLKCKNELFMLMMQQAEKGVINNAKEVLTRTVDRVTL